MLSCKYNGIGLNSYQNNHVFQDVPLSTSIWSYDLCIKRTREAYYVHWNDESLTI